MATTRRKAVNCGCRDCSPAAESCATLPPSDDAAARQDGYPKCLLLFGDGVLQAVPRGEKEGDSDGRAVRCAHLDAVARDGSSGFLALRKETFKDGKERGTLLQLAQLLGIHKEFERQSKSCKEGEIPNLSDRFMGLRAAFVSNSTSAAFLAESAGFHSLDVLDCGKAPTQPADYAVHNVFGLPSAGRVAKQLMLHLGVESASTQPTAPTRIDVREKHDNELDLLLLHIDAHAAMLSATAGTRDTAATPSETIATTESLMPQDTEVARCPASRPHSADPIEASCSCLEWLDDLLLALNESEEVRNQVLLCLVLGSQGDPLGQILEGGGRELEPWTAQAEHARGCGSQQGGQLPKLVRPRQSFQFCGLDYVEADLQLPLLTVCRCKGVVRCDCVQRVDVGDARALGGDAAILADRLLYGIAYTMGKATKYGA